MKLGCFSISLSVKDIKASKAFYEKLGFEVYAGELAHNFLIMKNGDTNIGLFQDMFEGNLLTFNPGWDQSAQPLDAYTDIREMKEHFKNQGIDIDSESIENDTGPANLSITDPDGNVILIDQHA